MSLIFAKSFAESNSGVGSSVRRGTKAQIPSSSVRGRGRTTDEEPESTQKWAASESRHKSLMEHIFNWAKGSNNRRRTPKSPRQVSFGVQQLRGNDQDWRHYLPQLSQDPGLRPRLVLGAAQHAQPSSFTSKTTSSSLDSTTTTSTPPPDESRRRIWPRHHLHGPRDLHDVTKDCLIIPEEFVHSFLPDGLTVPRSPGTAHVHVLEVADPRLPIGLQLFDVRSVCHYPDNINDDVVVRVDDNVLDRIRCGAVDDFANMHNAAKEGYHLRNLEPDADYPFINYFVLPSTPSELPRSRSSPWQLSLFSEVATIARPPVQMETKQPLTKATGFVVCIYKVFRGDNGQKFERNWLFWTGARMLYRNLPKHAGLRRMTLHRSSDDSELITYVLLVECTRFMYHLGQVANLLNVLRGRICGYTGLFRVVDSFL